MSSKGLIIKIQKIAKDILFSSYPQKYYHSLRVADIARDFARREDYGKAEILQIAAILHDISPYKDQDGENAMQSAKVAKRLLKDKLSKKEIATVGKAILATVKRPLKNHSIEEIILHDANILDLMGLIGLLRVAYNMGKENDRDSVEDLLQWFKIYSTSLQKLIINQHAKKYAAIKLSEIKKLG